MDQLESSLPNAQKNSGATVKATTSGSSREQSEDDENEGETEITENMDPADAKRVAQLGVENSSLLKRLSEINQKYNEAAVDNRVLKADVETLRAKTSLVENVQLHSGAAGLTENKLGRTASLQRVASLEHLQKRIRGTATPFGPQFNGEQQ
ncbi:hypothetical protein GH714_023640 [Hevea brasiliensis]|uniref:Basic leucine-zipper C-terminal domain-containing protein n=1 Tax=Hevea brasiliensis TaxID=3981 RepID=A0A6A6LFS7_HEVBR|nr:hypothetical protein GH714_023640 [Hevea brasiliensis]